MHEDGMSYVLRYNTSDAEVPMGAVINLFKKEDEKAGLRIVLNVGEEPATLIILLVLSGATTKAVWEN